MYAPLSPNPADAVARALAGSARGIAVKTSGSTGTPRDVLLGVDALLAAADGTHAALSGPGSWLLATPAHHIAGAMVLVRSHVAGTVATPMPPGSFSAQGFARAADALAADGPRYTSLVPTQLHRLLDSPVGRDALASFDAVLVGGAPLLTDAVPSNVIETYGATETAGGCIYDGEALKGVRIAVAKSGIVSLSGPMLADGYADGDDSSFVLAHGRRWFETSDLGEFQGESDRLRILGRADHAVLTGGETVHPAVVEDAMAKLAWVAESVAVGIPDAEWGERLIVLVVPRAGGDVPPWEATRAQLVVDVGRAFAPREMIVVDALPRLPSDKIDRAAARELALTEHNPLGGS